MKFNPFKPGSIVTHGMFVGRLDELYTIEQCLYQTIHNNPQHFLIEGERGIGKSSLLTLADAIASGVVTPLRFNDKMSFLTISVDMGGVYSQLDVIKTIARELKSSLSDRETLKQKALKTWDFLQKWEILGVRYHGDTPETAPDDARDDLAAKIIQLIDDAKESIDGVFIIIDEADRPEPDAKLGEFLKLFTERLTKRGCNKVLIGLAGLPSTIAKMKASHDSAPRIFEILNLEPLSHDERKEVVRSGLRAAREANAFETSITNEAIDLISELSEGYPHFIQQFAYSAFAEDSDDTIDVEDVKRGAYKDNGALAQLGVKYFNEMYHVKISSEDYRKVLNTMASRSDNWVSRKDIISESGVSESSVTNALSALKDRKIIMVEDGRRGFYRLPTKSFAAWINAFRSVKPGPDEEGDTLF
jgi:Cdc6-like AAA superfamily ATPase/biotin operon repressor